MWILTNYEKQLLDALLLSEQGDVFLAALKRNALAPVDGAYAPGGPDFLPLMLERNLLLKWIRFFENRTAALKQHSEKG